MGIIIDFQLLMELVVFEMFIWVHYIAAVLAIMLGLINLVSEKRNTSTSDGWMVLVNNNEFCGSFFFLDTRNKWG